MSTVLLKENRPPEMPKQLPGMVELLLSEVPESVRTIAATAMFPALATHLGKVTFLQKDGLYKSPMLSCVVTGRQSAGKSSVNVPIERIMKPIKATDEINRVLEAEWLESHGGPKARNVSPGFEIRYLLSDMTNAALVQRLKDANGKPVFCLMEELGLINQLRANNTPVSKVICLAFDAGDYGQERVGVGSVSGRVKMKWNWVAQSTTNYCQNFFRNHLDDGTMSRINFCHIEKDDTKPFIFNVDKSGKLDEALKPYLERLDNAEGEIACQEAVDFQSRMEQKYLDKAKADDNPAMEELVTRAVIIAFRKAMILYVANGCKWSETIENFAEWSLEYDLWYKETFFSESLNTKIEEGEALLYKPGRKGFLDELPDTFCIDDMVSAKTARHESTARLGRVLSKWKVRGQIEAVEGREGYYVKSKKEQSWKK